MIPPCKLFNYEYVFGVKSNYYNGMDEITYAVPSIGMELTTHYLGSSCSIMDNAKPHVNKNNNAILVA